MDRKKILLVAVIIAIASFAITCVTANSSMFNTPLYTLRMEQMSNKMNFLPTKINEFAYTTEKGYELNFDTQYDQYTGLTCTKEGDTDCGTCPGDTDCGTCSGDTQCGTCPGDTNCGTCVQTECGTCMGDTNCGTCPYTCIPGCGWTDFSTCPDTCEQTCPQTCTDTCPQTCSTCEQTSCICEITQDTCDPAC